MVGGVEGHRRNDRGQATVEFALVLPLLVVCIAGLVWVGQVVTLQVRLEHAAREGARAAAVEPEFAADRARRAAIQSMPDLDAVSAVVGAEFVSVHVLRTTGGVPLIGVGSRELTAVAYMRREDITP